MGILQIVWYRDDVIIKGLMNERIFQEIHVEELRVLIT